MVRLLPPYHANLGKRLVKSPKVYYRDSGLLHAMLNIETLNDLYGHPIMGASWEGFAIEQLISSCDSHWTEPFFYRTAAGAEIDLLLDGTTDMQAFEVKFGLSPKLTKGYHNSLGDLGLESGIVVYSGEESYKPSMNAEVKSLSNAMLDLAQKPPHSDALKQE